MLKTSLKGVQYEQYKKAKIQKLKHKTQAET